MFERVNNKSARLFPTPAEDLEKNPKLPAMRGTVIFDKTFLFVALWKRVSKNGNVYYTAEFSYPRDEESRLVSTKTSTSEYYAKAIKWLEEHKDSHEQDKRFYENRPSATGRTTEGLLVAEQNKGNDDEESLPF